MTDRDAASLSGAYALNALDADEVARFEAHLAQSEETRNESTELADTAVLLGLATDPIAPSPALKRNLMAQLATTPQLPREVTRPPEYRTADASRGRRAASGRRGAASRPGGAQSRAQARWFARPMVAIAGIAAAAVLIVGGGVLTNTLGQSMTQQAAADQLAAINSAPDSQRLAADISGGGTATLVWSDSLKSSAMIVDGLATLPNDKTYQLWYIDDSGARSAGTFGVQGAGSTWRVLTGDLRKGDTIGLTVEPSGGSTAPTTAPIVALQSA